MGRETQPPLPLAAIILAGGKASRLGGLDKANVELAGRPLISAALAAAQTADPLIVVGDTDAPLPTTAVVVREDPAGTGPAAGIAAGVEALPTGSTEWVLVLACDLPGAERGVERLRHAVECSAAEDTADGYCLLDTQERKQWVFGLYRRSVLAQSAKSRPSWANQSVRSLFERLNVRGVHADENEWLDVDTWEAHEIWHHRLLDASTPPKKE